MYSGNTIVLYTCNLVPIRLKPITQLCIYRMKQDCFAEEVQLILMDARLAQQWDYTVWEYTYDNKQVVWPIGPSICNAMNTFRIGGMYKYTSEMLYNIYTRYNMFRLASDI